MSLITQQCFAASCLLAFTPVSTNARTGDEVAQIQIFEIQEAGPHSPFARSTVTTSSIVTAATDDDFFMQDPIRDGDYHTSDGIFVYTKSASEAATGDQVELLSYEIQIVLASG